MSTERYAEVALGRGRGTNEESGNVEETTSSVLTRRSKGGRRDEWEEKVFDAPNHFVRPSVMKMSKRNEATQRCHQRIPKTCSSAKVLCVPDARRSQKTNAAVVSWTQVMGDSTLLKVTIQSRSRHHRVVEKVLRFPAPLLPGGVDAFFVRSKIPGNDAVALCGVTSAGSLHRALFVLSSSTGGDTLKSWSMESALAINPSESEDAMDDLTCATWINDSMLAIGGSDSRLLRVCTRRANASWTLSVTRAVSAVQWLWESVRGASTLAPVSALTSVVCRHRHGFYVISFGEDYVLRLWFLGEREQSCAAQFPLETLRKDMCTESSSPSPLYCDLSAGDEVSRNGDVTMTLHVADRMSKNLCIVIRCKVQPSNETPAAIDFVSKPIALRSKDEVARGTDVLAACVDRTSRVWILWSSPSDRSEAIVSCHRVHATRLMQTEHFRSAFAKEKIRDGDEDGDLSFLVDHDDVDEMPNSLVSTMELVNEICTTSRLDALESSNMNELTDRVQDDPKTIALKLNEFYFNKLSVVGRFGREAVANGLDDFGHHKLGLPRLTNKANLTWRQIRVKCVKVIDLSVHEHPTNAGYDEEHPIKATFNALLDREEAWIDLIRYCYMQHDQYMRTISLVPPCAQADFCAPLIVRAGQISVLWPKSIFRCESQYDRDAFELVHEAFRVMNLDRRDASAQMSEIGLGADADVSYIQEEKELRGAIFEIVERFVVSQADDADERHATRYSDADICACFNGISRPECLLMSYVRSISLDNFARVVEEEEEDDDDDDDAMDVTRSDRQLESWISALTESVIRNLRARFLAMQKVVVLIACLHRAGADWISRDELFSKAIRALQMLRIVVLLSARRLTSRYVNTITVSSPFERVHTSNEHHQFSPSSSLLRRYLASHDEELSRRVERRMRHIKTRSDFQDARFVQMMFVEEALTLMCRQMDDVSVETGLFRFLKSHKQLDTLHRFSSQLLPLVFMSLNDPRTAAELLLATGNFFLARAQDPSTSPSEHAECFARASHNFTLAINTIQRDDMARKLSSPDVLPVQLCLNTAHVFLQLNLFRYALDFAFMGIDQKSPLRTKVWALIIDTCLSDDTLNHVRRSAPDSSADVDNYFFTMDNLYDIAFISIVTGSPDSTTTRKVGEERVDEFKMFRLLNLLVDRRHLRWALEGNSPSSLWYTSSSKSELGEIGHDTRDISPLLLKVLKNRMRNNMFYSSSVELLYGVCVSRQRYREAAQAMLDLADSMDGLSNDTRGDLLMRRRRCLLAAMNALRLVPSDRAFLLRQRRQSTRGGSSKTSTLPPFYPVSHEVLEEDLAIATCRVVLLRHNVLDAKTTSHMSADECASAAINVGLYRDAFNLASSLKPDRSIPMICRVVRALAQHCVESDIESNSSSSRKGEEEEEEDVKNSIAMDVDDSSSLSGSSSSAESKWKLLRDILCSRVVKASEQDLQHRGLVWQSALRAMLATSRTFSIPSWMKGFFTGVTQRVVLAEAPLHYRNFSCDAVARSMRIFGALECAPVVLASSSPSSRGETKRNRDALRCVLVTFKSPVAAHAAVRARTVPVAGCAENMIVRFCDGRSSCGSKFGGEDAANPVALIRVLLDSGLIHEACDVAIRTFEAHKNLFETRHGVITSQPMWIPEYMLGELIWRACAACSVLYGTLRKWHEPSKTWCPRLCVAWRPSRNGRYVLEYAPHMGEIGDGKLTVSESVVEQSAGGDDNDAPFRFKLTTRDAGSHYFATATSNELQEWCNALSEMSSSTGDSSGEFDLEAVMKLRERISVLRRLVGETIRSAPTLEAIRNVKRLEKAGRT